MRARGCGAFSRPHLGAGDVEAEQSGVFAKLQHLVCTSWCTPGSRQTRLAGIKVLLTCLLSLLLPWCVQAVISGLWQRPVAELPGAATTPSGEAGP